MIAVFFNGFFQLYSVDNVGNQDIPERGFFAKWFCCCNGSAVEKKAELRIDLSEVPSHAATKQFLLDSIKSIADAVSSTSKVTSAQVNSLIEDFAVQLDINFSSTTLSVKHKGLLHDMRHKLSEMQFASAGLGTGKEEPSLQALKSSVDYLSKMIASFYQINDGSTDLFNTEYMKLQELLGSITNSCAILSMQHGVEFECLPLGDLNRIVIADAIAMNIHRSAYNLVLNAMKYTKTMKNPRAKLLIERYADNYVKFTIEDNGIGMTENVMKNLFGQYYRSEFTKNEPGSGLGLYTCKQLVEAMGGTIGFASSGLGKGSTFWFTAPCAETDEVVEEQKAVTKIVVDPKKSWVLIVDDDDFSNAATKRICKSLGIENADTVFDGDQAIEIFSKKHHSLIFMDTNLGDGKNGLAVTDWIRKYTAENSLQRPIIVSISGDAASPKQLKCDIDAYCPKPIKPHVIAGLLERRFDFITQQ